MNNINKQNNSSVRKVLSFLFTFVFVVSAFGLPTIDATNLQTTAGVNVSATAGAINVTAPDRAILSWQHFGSGLHAINAGERVEFVLPSSNGAVLNVVGGGQSTTINGAISSNGNVFILNPSGIVVGPTGTINVNGLYLSTVDDPAISVAYWNSNGKLPSQSNLPVSVLSNGITVSDGAVIYALNNNVTLASKVANVGSAVINGDLIIKSFGGNVVLGGSGTSVINGNIVINTEGLNNNGNVVQGTGTIIASSVSATSNDLSLPRLSLSGGTGNVSVTGNNVVVGNSGANTAFSGVIGGGLTLNGTNVVLNNVTNTGVGSTSISATARISLGTGISLSSTGTTSFSAPSIVDTQPGIFIYGPTSFVSPSELRITNAKHSFGPISVVAGGNAIVSEDATLNLSSVSVVGTFTGISQNDIVQLLPTSRTVSAHTNIRATNVILNDPAGANNFGTVSVVATGNATISQARNLTLGNSDVAGLLTISTINAPGAVVIEAAGSSIKAFGGLTITTNNGVVDISQTGNNFGLVTINTGTAPVILSESATINIGAINAGNVVLTSTGNITNTSDFATTSVVGLLNLSAGGNIILGPTIKTSGLTFNAVGITDLSALSFVTNLSGVYPVNTGTSTFLPPKP